MPKGQVKLRVNMILNGELVHEGNVLNREEIPLRMQKERFIGPVVEELPPQVIEESESPMPKRLILRRT
jgi:hypothetical protein